MFIIIIRMQQLRRVIGVAAASEQSVTYLVDNTGRAVLANAAMPGHAQADIDFVIKQGVKSGDTVSLQNSRSIIYHYENRLSGMRVITVIPENESTEKLRGIQRFALLLGLFSLGIFIMLGLLFAQSMSKPISRLVGNLRMIGENADHNMQIPVESSNEIGVIVGEINDMLAQRQLLTSNIMEMNSRMYELELEQKEARLIALQSQINPHFLYNTLECIRGIALVRDVPEIVKVAEGMSGIFRASASDAQTSTVREELALAGGYADIMSIRFSGRIRFTTEADETVLDQIIVKMILQPLVENAIYHGLEHVEEGGLVETRVLGEPDRILIEVRDNGSGIPGETIREMNECFRTGKPYTDPASGKTGLGLSNINKRLILHYGEGYGLTVGGAPGEGTVIRAELAYLQFNEIERGS
jgi:two-component system sensor histidine kinase YesM